MKVKCQKNKQTAQKVLLSKEERVGEGGGMEELYISTVNPLLAF